MVLINMTKVIDRLLISIFLVWDGLYDLWVRALDCVLGFRG